MHHFSQVVKTFPSVRIASETNGLPVEVSLIAQLGHGAGNQLFKSVSARQTHHADFINELDEPSTKIYSPNFSKNDPSSLYSFTVGSNGHPWHRHAGHRIFTAISGSGGVQLRFSNMSEKQNNLDTQTFLQSLRFVNIPADCLFTVRFGGETWHQFAPLMPKLSHPAFFALSCHPDELGGELSEEARQTILANEASIPSLTELLPEHIQTHIMQNPKAYDKVPVTTLSLDAAAGTFHRLVCDVTRRGVGTLRGAWQGIRNTPGYMSNAGLISQVHEQNKAPESSLLSKELKDNTLHHEDSFSVFLSGVNLTNISASRLLELVLDGFVTNAPQGVSRLMRLRNFIVKPIGLRTSPLGCPVSSLLSDKAETVFANKYPVLSQRIGSDQKKAEVILGANDKHLIFRSSVEVEILNDYQARISLSNRIHCKNWFGKFYMMSISKVHRHYISPIMLGMACDYASTHLDER